MKQAVFIGVPTFFGIFAIVFIWLVLSEKKLPYITDDKSAFIAILILGIVMCTIGIGLRTMGPFKYTNSSDWFNILNVIEGISGVIATIIIIAVTMGKKIPIIGSYKMAFYALSIIIITKSFIALIKGILNQ